jgi:hypothetical protein
MAKKLCNATMVVGYSSGALANAVLLPPGAGLLELLPRVHRSVNAYLYFHTLMKLHNVRTRLVVMPLRNPNEKWLFRTRDQPVDVAATVRGMLVLFDEIHDASKRRELREQLDYLLTQPILTVAAARGPWEVDLPATARYSEYTDSSSSHDNDRDIASGDVGEGGRQLLENTHGRSKKLDVGEDDVEEGTGANLKIRVAPDVRRLCKNVL